MEAVHLYPEAARYYFALYNAPGADPSAQEKALAGLSNILLLALEWGMRVGSGDLSMDKDSGAMDTGPGYLNGILSLLLNTTDPASHYSEEEQRAVPYFHRSRAAELIAFLDQKFPNAASRPELHARLIEAYDSYGQDEAVVRTGHEFLAAFPKAEQRNQVALLMADSFARTNNTKEEFAIYDAMLQELARKADGIPLGEHFNEAVTEPETAASENDNSSSSDAEGDESTPARKKQQPSKPAFAVKSGPSQAKGGPRSPEYVQVLDRYISRARAAFSLRWTRLHGER